MEDVDILNLVTPGKPYNKEEFTANNAPFLANLISKCGDDRNKCQFNRLAFKFGSMKNENNMIVS